MTMTMTTATATHATATLIGRDACGYEAEVAHGHGSQDANEKEAADAVQPILHHGVGVATVELGLPDDV